MVDPLLRVDFITITMTEPIPVVDPIPVVHPIPMVDHSIPIVDSIITGVEDTGL